MYKQAFFKKNDINIFFRSLQKPLQVENFGKKT